MTLSIGAASFSCLGIALTAAIPSEDAAAPVTNVALLPLYFLSGSSFRVGDPGRRPPRRRRFPIRHFFEAFFPAWDPSTAEPASSGVTSRWSASGGSPASRWRFDLSLDAQALRRAESARLEPGVPIG